MIALALFAVAAILFVVANYWREQTVPEEGALRPSRATSLLMIEAACATVGAILLANVHMITFVS